MANPSPDIARPTWDDLDAQTKLDELRLDTASVFYEEFADDPTVVWECDRHGRVVLTRHGICDQCGHEIA